MYTVTDVKDLYEWEKEHCISHPLFQLLTEKSYENDPSIFLALNSTEESKKVEREGREKYHLAFRRVAGEASTFSTPQQSRLTLYLFHLHSQNIFYSVDNLVF